LYSGGKTTSYFFQNNQLFSFNTFKNLRAAQFLEQKIILKFLKTFQKDYLRALREFPSKIDEVDQDSLKITIDSHS